MLSTTNFHLDSADATDEQWFVLSVLIERENAASARWAKAYDEFDHYDSVKVNALNVASAELTHAEDAVSEFMRVNGVAIE